MNLSILQELTNSLVGAKTQPQPQPQPQPQATDPVPFNLASVVTAGDDMRRAQIDALKQSSINQIIQLKQINYQLEQQQLAFQNRTPELSIPKVTISFILPLLFISSLFYLFIFF